MTVSASPLGGGHSKKPGKSCRQARRPMCRRRNYSFWPTHSTNFPASASLAVSKVCLYLDVCDFSAASRHGRIGRGEIAGVSGDVAATASFRRRKKQHDVGLRQIVTKRN